jgi:hypothetical protein
LYNSLFAAIIFSTVIPYLQLPYSQLISYTNSSEITTPLPIMTNVQSEAEAPEVVEKKEVTLEQLDPPNSGSTSLEIPRSRKCSPMRDVPLMFPWP